ncbi:MAG TPA: response regulator [Cytophagales bacterium]|nr:response regulator [Cytophagales bacterium]
MLIKRVILLDDDPICNFLTKRMLESKRVTSEILIFTTADDALEYLNGLEYPEFFYEVEGLILLDINMPGKDGFEFLNAFRLNDHYRRFKVFMLSSSHDPQDLEEACKHNIEVLFSKPFDEKHLNSLISRSII